MMKRFSNKSGQALIVILMICLFLGIVACVVLNLQSSQINLLSKSAKDYLSLSVAESGLHCVLAEMKADYQFVTHGNPYVPNALDKWPSPAERRYNYLKSSNLLKIGNNGRGTYTGSVEFPTMKMKGDFKVRMKLLESKNSDKSKTVDERHRYFLLESYGKVGDSCRKISTIVERFVPGNFLLYDGQVLDVGGYGPYRITPGMMTSGRLYGHEMVVFSKRGNTDRTAELSKIEKISTPGYIKSEAPVNFEFFCGPKGSIKPNNDSTDPDKFQAVAIKQGGKITDRLILDGNHGGKPQLLPPLNPSYWRNAKKPSPEILRAGSSFEGFKESKWRNPAKPGEVVYDLFFGWDFQNETKSVLIYSEVPLRIWGCPKWKALTIFCEKDVYIAGDFNANPDGIQSYTDGYRSYSKTPRNGTDKNGCQVMSMGRIWFDYSNPMNFLRNEMEVVIDYDIACTLNVTEPSNLILKSIVWPSRSTTGPMKRRMPMTFLNFSAINTLFNMPKEDPELLAAVSAIVGLHPSLSRLRAYLNKPGEKEEGDNGTWSAPVSSSNNTSADASMSGGSAPQQPEPAAVSASDDGTSDPEKQKVHFPITSKLVRTGVYEAIGVQAYTVGTILPAARDKLVKMILNEAEKEMDEDEPNPDLGPWHIADRMFNLAVNHKDTGLRFPEMTVNAMLVDSAELNARWDFGNSANKVQNELGNIQSKEMRSFPWIGAGSRFILRHHGSMVHLRNRKVKEFLNGSLRDDQSVIRHMAFDPTFASGGGDYFPPYPISGFTIINWQDEYCSEEEYNKIN